MIYDVHAPPSQFFFTGHCYATLHSACPLIAARIRAMPAVADGGVGQIDCVAFPDEGACKRFGAFFAAEFGRSGMELVTCCKKRNPPPSAADAAATAAAAVDAGPSSPKSPGSRAGSGRSVVIFDGDPRGKHCLIMDDLIQTGGTLFEAAVALKAAGALSVSGFVVHAVFPDESWRRFLKGGDRGGAFTRFWLTNSNPHVCAALPVEDVFEVLDLSPQILLDL
jgi:phosphoribosylpyrophosphate synthetase